MAKGGLTLVEAVERLRVHHGPPVPPPTVDPFELVLLENVAYLATPERRREAFAQLRRSVGTSPAAILKAGRRALERVTSHGILESTFAAKLRECARVALEEFGGDLRPLLRGPVDAAASGLRKFPGIGVPAADRILMFTGRLASLAPDSNGLRVLVRLGFVREHESYSRTYAASREAAKALPSEPRTLQEAHLLLQHHGRTLCRRSAPRCDACPLAEGCAYVRGTRRLSGPTRRRR
jgi:endonuclease III